MKEAMRPWCEAIAFLRKARQCSVQDCQTIVDRSSDHQFGQVGNGLWTTAVDGQSMISSTREKNEKLASLTPRRGLRRSRLSSK